MSSDKPEQSDTATDSRKLESRLWIIVLVSILATALVLGGYAHTFRGPLSPQHELWGQFGDYVGGILNPIFGFLALIGLLLTIALQSRELHNSTAEVRKTVSALNLQNESFQKQTFESAFFNLLRFQNDILKDIDIRANTAEATGVTLGRDCFRVYYRRLNRAFDGFDAEDPLHRAVEAYLIFHEKNQADLGHYFRHLYQIFKFVDGAAVKNPRYYTNLIRAQLSSYELLLLFYNCVSPLGREKFKPLVEEYSLLKNMPEDRLLLPLHRSFYADSAYRVQAAG